MSECDNKCETRNAEPVIGTDGSTQTSRNPLVDRSGSWFGLPRVSGSGFWTCLEPNRPVFAVQTRTAAGLPESVANTRHSEIPDALSKLTACSNEPTANCIDDLLAVCCANKITMRCTTGNSRFCLMFCQDVVLLIELKNLTWNTAKWIQEINNTALLRSARA
jgi:hypothetical protein